MSIVDIDDVDNDIPLLIGRPTMTELGMVLNTVTSSYSEWESSGSSIQ